MPHQALKYSLSKLTICRQKLLGFSTYKVIHCCQNCSQWSKECKVGGNSDSYTECAGINLFYDLAFSKAKLCYLQKKYYNKMRAMMDAISCANKAVSYATEVGFYAIEASAHAAHLKTKVKGLEKQEEEFIYYKLQNIKEFKYNEQ